MQMRERDRERFILDLVKKTFLWMILILGLKSTYSMNCVFSFFLKLLSNKMSFNWCICKSACSHYMVTQIPYYSVYLFGFVLVTLLNSWQLMHAQWRPPNSLQYPVWWGTLLIIPLLGAQARNLPFFSIIVSVCYLCLCCFSPATAPTTHKHTFTSHLWAGLPCVQIGAASEATVWGKYMMQSFCRGVWTLKYSPLTSGSLETMIQVLVATGYPHWPVIDELINGFCVHPRVQWVYSLCLLPE